MWPLPIWRAESEQQHGWSWLLLLFLICWSILHSGRIDSLNKQTSWYSIKQTKQFFVLWFLACSMSPVKRTDICSCQKYIAAHMAAIYHMHMWMETGSTASSIIWRIEIWAIQLELDICLFSCSRYQDDLFNSMELVSLQLHFSM